MNFHLNAINLEKEKIQTLSVFSFSKVEFFFLRERIAKECNKKHSELWSITQNTKQSIIHRL